MQKRTKDRKNTIKSGIAEKLNLSTIDLISNKEATLCGCSGVVEYDENNVKINCGDIIACFSGTELSIKALSVEELIVSGEIVRIEFTNC